MSRDRDRDEPEELSHHAQFVSFYRLNNSLDAAAGDTPHEFNSLQPHEQEAWVSCFESAQRIAREGEGKRLDVLGKELAESFLCSLNPESPTPWDAITPSQQLKWPMLVRHAAELMAWNTLDQSIETYEDWILENYKAHLPTPQEAN